MVKKQMVPLRILLQRLLTIRPQHHRRAASHGDRLAYDLWTNTGALGKTNRSHPLERTSGIIRHLYGCLVVTH